MSLKGFRDPGIFFFPLTRSVIPVYSQPFNNKAFPLMHCLLRKMILKTDEPVHNKTSNFVSQFFPQVSNFVASLNFRVFLKIAQSKFDQSMYSFKQHLGISLLEQLAGYDYFTILWTVLLKQAFIICDFSYCPL
jgi:hypothetical protein